MTLMMDEEFFKIDKELSTLLGERWLSIIGIEKYIDILKMNKRERNKYYIQKLKSIKK
jgi:hypothetical protein